MDLGPSAVRQFPADFISEAIDQTRGWFYTLHAISTLITGGPCYKSCLVLGHILDEKGVKMSKRLGNVVDPWKVINDYGADAFRWYFYSSGSLTSGARFSEKGVLESLQRFIIPLWNVYSFLSIYSNLDGFDPGAVLAGRGLAWEELAELDKWILLKLNRLRSTVADGLDRLSLSDSARALESFVEELSNWYVRRSRRRFWQSERDNTKLAAYETLYKVLVELSKLLAPFIPFIAEELYQKLVVRFGGAESAVRTPPGASAVGTRPAASAWQQAPVPADSDAQAGAPAPTRSVPSSVHLCAYPERDLALSDDALETAMDQTLRAARLGHSARKESRLRVRQPLRKVVLVTREPGVREAIEAHREILLEELNVKAIEFAEDETLFVSCQYKPNFRLLGPRFGAQAKAAAAWISGSSAEISRQLDLHRGDPVSVLVENEDGEADLAETKWFNWVELTLDGRAEAIDERYFEVVLHAHEESIAERDGGLLLVLDTHVDAALKLEGLAREVVHRLQARRKELDLEYSQRINVSYRAEGELATAIETQGEYISAEILAVSLRADPALPRTDHGSLNLDATEGEIDGQLFIFTLEPA